MFEKLKYKKATAGFLNPSLASEVSRINFLKILRGEVVNPFRLENPQTHCDYSYFVVGAPYKSPLNSWAGQPWGPNCFEIAEEQSLWYGRFYTERTSTLIVPSKKTIVMFNPKSDSPLGKVACTKYVHPLYQTGGTFQADKTGDRTLLSSLDLEDLRNILYNQFKLSSILANLV
ncbi:hypothetical protein KA107_00110 [Candidatus Pacearchaeota archaeon]|nr:hypothetical protein [Candidatus Pacearchaeota archaeon]